MIRGRPHIRLWLLVALVLCGVGACGPAFFVLAKIDDAVERYKDQRLPPYLCGNAICDRGRGESCRSCPADCGRCDRLPPELMALAPEAGKANRWVSVFGSNLGRVEHVWLTQGTRLVRLRHKHVGTRLNIFIPANATGGTVHVESGGKRRPTPLSYAVRP